MVQGVGGAGASGSIKDLTEYKLYYPMYQKYNKDNDRNLSFEAYLTLKGYIKHFNQQVENYLETGSNNIDDGTSGNTISDERHISGGNTAIYQSQDEETYYEFDYEKGEYRIIQGKEEIANALGLPDTADFDRIKFGAGSVQFYDYTFGGLDDGQDSKNYGVAGRFGNVSLTKQEFDIDYILNALLMDPSDPQYNIAKGIFDDLCASVSQWLPDSDMDDLNKTAAEFGTESAQYKAMLKEVLINNLDQAQEWIDDHTHVKNVNGGSLFPENPDGTEKPGGGEGGNKPDTPKIPSTDRLSAISNTSSYGNYNGNKSISVSDYGKGDEMKADGIAEFTAQARSILSEQANAIRSQMQAKMGDEYDEALVNQYLDKAMVATISQFTGYVNYRDDYGDGGNYHTNDNDFNLVFAKRTKNKGRICYNVKNLINYFYDQFDSLSVNNGKTNAEVEAEKKAAEEKKAKETEAFKTLYNMNMKSTAQEAGVDPNKDIQVVNVASASEIQSKAESQILVPLKTKIKQKLAGKGMSDADINTILDNSAKAALADCTDWSTTNNNFVYTINTDKLISRFESNVKTMVKNKGYNF